MLKKFSVTNFKGFKKKLTLNLGNPSNYEFNNHVIQNGCISKAMIYGINGSGKSNLALALFDIILQLTDKEKLLDKYRIYINLDSKSNYARFEYVFEFRGKEVIYKYEKQKADILLRESLTINGEEVIYYDFQNNEGFSTLSGTENINLKSNAPMGGIPISRVKYLKNTTILNPNDENNTIFIEFNHFIDGMLMFYSLDNKGYQGLLNGSESISNGIIRAGKTKQFEDFLKSQGVEFTLIEKNINGEKEIYCQYVNGDVNFWEIASTGTRSLALFYYWYILMETASFVYIDEFDAFYHFELSETLVKMLSEIKNTQIIVSTHNTDLLSNDLLRPDCYFILEDNKLESLNNLVDKDLRKAHNLQKMYKAGSFNRYE